MLCAMVTHYITTMLSQICINGICAVHACVLFTFVCYTFVAHVRYHIGEKFHINIATYMHVHYTSEKGPISGLFDGLPFQVVCEVQASFEWGYEISTCSVIFLMYMYI